MLSRRCVIALLAVGGLSVSLTGAVAAPGLPQEVGEFGLDTTSQDALSGLVGLHAGGVGLAIADAAGAQHLAANGDVLYTVGGGAAGEDLLVDSSGTGYATVAGDTGVHVVAPDGHNLATYDLSWVNPGIQPTALTLDSNAPHWFRRTLYVQTTYGTMVLDLDSATADVASDSGFVPTLPQGILAVAPDHTLFITSGTSHTIWHYTDDGIKLASLTVPGDPDDAPSPVVLKGLAIDSTGTIFAADAANSRVVELSTAGAVLGQFGEASPFPSTASSQFTGVLDAPGLLAVDCHGALWVADSDTSGKARIVDFTGVAAPTGACAPAPASLAVGPTSQQAGSVTVDRAGNRYLSAYGKVEKYDASGHLVLSWGSDNPTVGPPASFGQPSGLGADPVSGDVWVLAFRWFTSDGNGNITGITNADPKLLRFGPTGALRAKITAPSGGGATFVTPGALAVRPSDGHVFVGDSTLQTVQEMDRNGALVRTMPLQPLAGAEPSTTPLIVSLGFDKLGDLLISMQQRAGHVSSPSSYTWVVGGVEKYSVTGSYLTTVPVPQNSPTADPPRAMALLADGSMLWSSAPNLPPAPFGTPRMLLAVNSSLVPTRAVLDGSLSPNSAPGLAVDCRGNVDLTDPAASRLLMLRYTSKRCLWLPSATTGVVASRATASVTVKGSANPSAQVTKIRVLYGATTKYGKATKWMTLASDNVAVTKSFVLSGLSSAHTYHYKVQVTNASGTVTGKDRTASTR